MTMPRSGSSATGLPVALPVNKVATSTIAGAVTAITVWLLNSYGGIQIPDGVENALIVLVTFAIGWLTPPGADEKVVAPPFGPAGRETV